MGFAQSVLVLAVLLAQDRVGELIRQLDGPKGADAADALIELGAEEALKTALPSLPAGARFWARAALDEMDALRRLGDRWALPPRRDIAWNETPLEDAVADLTDWWGLRVGFWDDNWRAKTIGVERKGATPARALVALGNAAELQSYLQTGPAPTFGGDGSSGKVSCWRNLLSVFHFGRIEQEYVIGHLPKKQVHLWMWTVPFGPLSDACNADAKFTLVEAIDAKGNSLLLPEPPRPAADPELYSDPVQHSDARPSQPSPCFNQLERFQECPALKSWEGDSSLAVLRATHEISVPVKYASLILELGGDPVQMEGTLGPLKIRVRVFDRVFNSCRLKITATGPASVAPHLHFHLRQAAEDRRVLQATLRSWSDGGSGAIYDIKLYHQEASVFVTRSLALPEGLEVRLVEATERVRLPVELRDLKGPP
jgi:hypothetical protein